MRWWQTALCALPALLAAAALIVAARMAGSLVGDVIRDSGYTVGGVTFQEREKGARHERQ